jgi:acetoin utilization protein AcuB
MELELVRDWMTRNVITVAPNTTLPEAERLMITKMIRRLPVIDDGRLVGIVTYGDIRKAQPSAVTSLSIWEVNYLLAKVRVSEIMTADPITVSQDATIGEAAQLMLNHMISGLPVVDHKGDLVGIITESDIFRLVVKAWSGSKPELAAPYARYH